MDTQFASPVALPHVDRAHGAVLRGDWRALRIVLVIGDCACIAASFYLAYVLRFWTGWELFHEAGIRPTFYAALTQVLMPCWVGIFALYGLYDLRNLLGGTKEYALAFNGCLLGMLLVMVVSFLVPDFVIARAWLIIAWLSAVTFTVAWRFTARRAVYALRSRGHLSERIVVLGANSEGRAVAAQLSAWQACGAQIVGFIDNDLALGEQVLPHMPVLGPPTAFQAIVEQYRVDAVIIADTAMVRDRLPLILGAMDVLQRLDVRLAPGLFELLTTGVRVREQGGVPLLSLNKTRITGLHAFGKLLIDRVGALVGLLALSPLLVLIALLIKLDDGGPIFHRRRVVGVGKWAFDALKFRTMIRDAG
ncbi:MAG: sugar transferase, partial [Chloroflexales bacterium]|nr:sugar transferase [Chloroflexales bacterium]